MITINEVLSENNQREACDILPPPMLRIEAGASRSSIPMNTVSTS